MSEDPNAVSTVVPRFRQSSLRIQEQRFNDVPGKLVPAQTSKLGDPGTHRETSNSFAALELELRLRETDTKTVNLSSCFERSITKPSKQEIFTTNTSR